MRRSLLLLVMAAPVLLAHDAWAAADRPCLVDDRGILRWADDRTEVAVFGVNTCVPCTQEFAALGSLGMDRRQVVDQDVLHWQRLGLTSYRVPVWDREISDRDGNLLPNEHLALLDHLIAAAKARGLYAVLTPIVSYATVNASPGFSTLFPMEQLTSDPGKPREAQCRFLAQFVQHRNPETGLTYAEDPGVLVFELINEPLYPRGIEPAQVTGYINALAAAVRETGCRKPLFYNCWMGTAGAAADSTINGVTFGWYPTGLVSGGMLTGNYLNLVNDFPAMREPVLAKKARGVYEFDAADVPWGYLYPAMARALRAGGAQFANQFQYDHWPLATSNCFCQTHYLSLPFTPGKAVSLLIAGEAFRRLPRLQRPGALAPDGRFGPFRVSYPRRLSEMVTDAEFLYSGDTTTRPPSPGRLTRVVGVGSSPAVSYEGTGAYFLDRLRPGAWRLEVYPDVVWTADPFAKRSERDETARVIWTRRRMTLRLPDLGALFAAQRLDRGARPGTQARGGAVTVTPGVYLLLRPGARAPEVVSAEFFAPPPPARRPTAVWHKPPQSALAGSALSVAATCTRDRADLTLCYQTAAGWQRAPMPRTAAYQYAGLLPAEAVREGTLRYALVLRRRGEEVSFPAGLPGWPGGAAVGVPLALWEPGQSSVAPSATTWGNPGARADCALTAEGLSLRATGLDPQVDCGAEMRWQAKPASGRPGAVLRVRARSLEPATSRAQVTLIQDDGRTYATDLRLGPDFTDTDLALPEWFPCWSTTAGRPDPARVREVSVALGRWLQRDLVAQPQGVEVAGLALVEPPEAWEVPVAPVGPPVPLLTARMALDQQPWQLGLRVAQVIGPGGEPALELAHPGYGPPPDCSVVSWSLPPASTARTAALARCRVLRLTLRSRTPALTRLQVGLTEADGAPWGVDVEVPPEWGTVEVPLGKLAFFGHWARPEGRGGRKDRFHPDRLGKCTLAIGAWLNPAHASEPHVLQVASMELTTGRP
jgi:hypothetical protein